MLGSSLESVPFGTAYVLWTGIGVAGTLIVGMVALGEPTDGLRVGCLVLIITGVAGLKLSAFVKAVVQELFFMRRGTAGELERW